MTNKEAIEILKLYKQRLDESCSNLLDRDKEALDLAIKALNIVDIINEELSPADEDKAVWFDIPHFEEIQERANMRR